MATHNYDHCLCKFTWRRAHPQYALSRVTNLGQEQIRRTSLPFVCDTNMNMNRRRYRFRNKNIFFNLSSTLLCAEALTRQDEFSSSRSTRSGGCKDAIEKSQTRFFQSRIKFQLNANRECFEFSCRKL